MLVLIGVKTGFYLGPWANVVIDLRVEVALHDIFLVPIVCTCPTAWGIGDLRQTAAVEEKRCTSAVGSKSPGAVELVEKEAFDRFNHQIFMEVAMLNSKLLCHCVGQFYDVIRHFSKSPDNRPEYPVALVVRVGLSFKSIARVTSPCIQRFGPG